jgi:hypothetical protein
MVRISLLLLSLALMAVAVIRFAVETKKNWASSGLITIVRKQFGKNSLSQ